MMTVINMRMMLIMIMAIIMRMILLMIMVLIVRMMLIILIVKIVIVVMFGMKRAMMMAIATVPCMNIHIDHATDVKMHSLIP